MSAIRFIIFFSFTILLAFSVQAATFETPVKEGDRLVVKGLEAQVVLSGVSTSGNLKISGLEDSKSAGLYTVRRNKNIIEVSMNEFDGKRSWLNILSKPGSAKKIEISGLSIPTEIQLRGGSVQAQKWTKDLKVSLTQGKVTSLNGNGMYQVYVQKGDVNIQEHNGKVSVDGYSGNCALRNIQGDVEVSWFSGQLGMEKIIGFVSLSVQQATAKLNQGSGSVQFETGKGNLVLQGFQGRIEGSSQEGSVSVTMPLDSEVDIKSKTGRVTIQLPGDSGAQVNLFMADGEIKVPGELRVARAGNEKIVRGKLRGNAQRTSVFVRSQEGSIILK